MKNKNKKELIPRIFSLSTIGIIHHDCIDFLFHSVRTDFNGESGFGKSIIADLLQLILTGGKNYESSGEGNRPVSGLVLNTHAYTFLNIRLQKGYLVIGVYLRSASSSHTTPFIIHKGLKESKITPFEEPFLRKEIIDEFGNYPEFNELKRKFINKYNIEKYTHDNYLHLLFNEGIHPIDFKLNEDKLKHYVWSLKAFARGKDFDLDKEEHIKNFLFNDNKAEKIYDDYRTGKQKIYDDFKSQYKNNEQLNQLEIDKNNAIDLIKLKNECERLEKEYILIKVNYSYRNMIITRNKFLLEIFPLYKELSCKRLILEKFSNEKDLKQNNDNLNELNDKKRQLDDNVKKIEDQKSKSINFEEEKEKFEKEKSLLTANIQKGKDFEKWLKKYENIDKLKEYFEKQNKIIKDKDIINSNTFVKFENYLIDNELANDFNKSLWITDYENANKLFNDEINKLASEIEYYENIKKFADRNDENSLINWAIKENREFTLFEESLIHHLFFNKISRIQPEIINDKNIIRYLPNPNFLFNAIKKDRNDSWLDLYGLKEYIPILKEENRILNCKDIAELEKNINKKTNENKKILTQKNEEKRKKELMQKINEISGFNKSTINIYNRKKAINDFKIDYDLNLSQDTLNDYIQCYDKKKDNENAFEKLTKEFGFIDIEKLESDNITLQNRISELEKLPINENIIKFSNKIEELNSDINKLKKKIKHFDIDLFYNEISKLEQQFSEYKKLSDNITTDYNEAKNELYKLIENYKLYKKENNDFLLKLLGFVTLDLSNLQFDFDDSANKNWIDFLKKTKDKLNAKYEKTVESDLQQIQFAVQELILLNSENPDDKGKEKDKYDEALNNYKFNYNQYFKIYVNEESLQTNNDDLELLLRKILSELFIDKFNYRNINFINEITNEFKKVIDNQNQIYKKNIDFLMIIFKELIVEIGKYEASYIKMKEFLDKNKGITNTITVVLEYDESNNYKIDFLHKMHDRLTFELTKQISIEFDKKEVRHEIDLKQSIDNIITKTYNDTYLHKDEKANVQTILNPLNYFKVSLHLNPNTPGSTGQRYTAKALLCLAKLYALGYDENSSAIRIMPIDESDGIGSNFKSLYDIAENKKYQIIAMSVYPMRNIEEGNQYIYNLNPNPDNNNRQRNLSPFAIFSEFEEVENIDEEINKIINEQEHNL